MDVTYMDCQVCGGTGVVEVPTEDVGEKHIADKVLSEVSREYEVTVALMVGESRQKHITAARHVAEAKMRRYGMCLKTIGLYLGNRDHSSIVHGVRRGEAILNSA